MVKPYKDSSSSKKEQVTSMFDGIAKNYDALNRVISMGIDKSWRRKLVAMVAQKNPKKVVDVATGTGDLALALTSIPNATITGIDIAVEMLEIGKHKVNQNKLDHRIKMVVGDAESLPLTDASIDAVTVAFGVRNFGDLNKGLSEIYRILKPGGQLFVLETSVPKKQFFRPPGPPISPTSPVCCCAVGSTSGAVYTCNTKSGLWLGPDRACRRRIQAKCARMKQAQRRERLSINFVYEPLSRCSNSLISFFMMQKKIQNF